jgi:hypothetical protein
LVSAPVTGYAAFWINAHGEPQMGAVQPRLRLVWPPNKSEFPLGLNEHRTDDRAVLYTPALGHKSSDFKSARQSTRTISGLELTLEPTDAKAWLPFEPGKRYSARVAKVDKNGDSALGPKTAVISLGPQLLKIFPQVAVGDQLTLNLDTDPDLSGVKTAIGGGFQLLKLGKKLQLEKADNVRHPRSMLGWNRTHYFLVVVDGRQPKHSIGMTYFELAGLGARLECTDAMALDGGGSSTLWADGRVLNSPSDGKLRAVANALILLERKANVSPR